MYRGLAPPCACRSLTLLGATTMTKQVVKANTRPVSTPVSTPVDYAAQVLKAFLAGDEAIRASAKSQLGAVCNALKGCAPLNNDTWKAEGWGDKLVSGLTGKRSEAAAKVLASQLKSVCLAITNGCAVPSDCFALQVFYKAHAVPFNREKGLTAQPGNEGAKRGTKARGNHEDETPAEAQATTQAPKAMKLSMVDACEFLADGDADVSKALLAVFASEKRTAAFIAWYEEMFQS